MAIINISSHAHKRLKISAVTKDLGVGEAADRLIAFGLNYGVLDLSEEDKNILDKMRANEGLELGQNVISFLIAKNL